MNVIQTALVAAISSFLFVGAAEARCDWVVAAGSANNKANAAAFALTHLKECVNNRYRNLAAQVRARRQPACDEYRYRHGPDEPDYDCGSRGVEGSKYRCVAALEVCW